MTDTGTISTYESGVDLVVEWKIENFFNLPERDGGWYSSPDFSFGGETWHLTIYPNGWSGSDSSGHVNLDLWKCDSGRPIKQSFSLSLKTTKGKKYNEQNVTKDFKGWDYHSFDRFIQRSDLTRRSYELVPDGVLTVVCAMKSSTSAGSASNTASTSDKCCHCKITFNAQNLSSHQKRCMHRPIKCPDCLEVVVLQKWLDEHECQKERSEGKSREENSKNTCVEACTQTEKENDYNCREELLMALCIVSILIAIVTGCAIAYSKTPLSSSHPCGDLVMSNEQLQEKIAELEAVAETLKVRESELNAIKKEHGELKCTYESIANEKNKLKHCLDSEKQNLVMSNEQLQEKTAKLKAVAETLKVRESELNAIKKEHGELKCAYESIASEKNKLKQCLDSEKQNLVQLKKEMEEKQSKIDSITKELRKKETDLNDFKNKNEKLILKIKEIESEKKLLEEKATVNEKPLPQPVLMVTEVGSTYLEIVWVLPEESKTNAAHILHYIVYFRKYEAQWQEVAFPDASRTSYSITNLDPGMTYQIYVMAVDSSGFNRPSETAIVRTSNKVIYHNSSKDHEKELAATIIIYIIAITCVYVYSKTSLSVQHPYGEGTQTISAEEDNIVKADLSEVAETDEPEASDSKTCATETEEPITFNNAPEECGFVTDINHLLNENRSIDVTFELETPNGKTKLFAHKLILAVMSSYFADVFYDKGRNKGHQVIPLKGIDPKPFEQMIRYCYGEKLSLRSTDDSCALFKVASEFKVISLRNLCHTFFRHTKIEPGNVFSILKISVEMEDQSLQDMCYKILQEKTREVLSAYDLCDVTPAMVYTLLNLPKLSLNSEYQLINWLFNWGKVKAEDKDSSCISTRDYLAKLLRNMNFLALTVKEFAMLTRDHPNFFNSDEIASVSMNIVIPGTREIPVWHNEDLKVRVYTGSNE